METYDNKTITKKEIHRILRTRNRTAIFKLFHRIYGGKVKKSDVYLFILDFAPSVGVVKDAFRIAYDKDAKPYYNPMSYIRYREKNLKNIAMSAFRDELKRGLDNYTKKPMICGDTLYFASPIYGAKDYNKWQMMPVQGNEHFCEILCRLADKYYQTQKIKED